MTNIEDASDIEGRPMRRPMRRLTLRSKIMRGVVAPFFALLAVLSVVLGVANATFWKPSNVVIAYANVSGTRYIVTDPGVLNLVDNRVRISVAALHTRKPICVAVGLTKDVRGWVAGSPVQRITGLRDWNNLSVSEVSGKTSVQAGDSVDIKDPDVKFQESNLWPIVTCQLGLAKLAINTADYVQSSGSASYDHAVASGTMPKSGTRASKSNSHDASSSSLRSQAARRVLLIDLGDNVPEASVELRWRRNQIPDFATPLYFVGVLFAVLAILSATIFAMAPHRRRNKQLIASRSGVLAVKSAQRDEVTFAERFLEPCLVFLVTNDTRRILEATQGMEIMRVVAKIQCKAATQMVCKLELRLLLQRLHLLILWLKLLLLRKMKCLRLPRALCSNMTIILI